MSRFNSDSEQKRAGAPCTQKDTLFTSNFVDPFEVHNPTVAIDQTIKNYSVFLMQEHNKKSATTKKLEIKKTRLSSPEKIEKRSKRRCKFLNQKLNFLQVVNKSDDEYYLDQDEYSEDEYIVPSYTQPSKPRNTVSKNSEQQPECCLIGCSNEVNNRLRFSLRTHEIEDYKQEFVDRSWDKVCHYHYFSDLYKFKKMTNGTATKPLNPKRGAPKKK